MILATTKRISRLTAILGLLIYVIGQASSSASAQQTEIKEAHPTHNFYTPAPYINPEHALVIGLHELSYALPYRLQLQASLLDNIGRLNLAAKFGILDNLSLAAGLAHSLIHVGRGTHGIPEWASPRFGAFLCYGPLLTKEVEIGITPHTQVGDHVSLGGDLGLKFNLNIWWAILFEVGSSMDFTDERLYMNFDGGIRINPPKIAFLHFDLGVDIEEFPLVDGVRPSVTVFFDVLFGMMVN